MLIPLLNLHAKIMESIVSGSSSFPHDTRVYILDFPLLSVFLCRLQRLKREE